MAKRARSFQTTQAAKRMKRVDAIDPQETLESLKTIDRVLRMRFPEYSPNVKLFEPLGAILDMATLDDVFARACYEKTFKSFCRSVHTG